jgi:UDP-N-acetylglucosamine--N-acetylmuramyl-(pentapeptide) pyrophosphoryl-undecaprenol N-acetylglucosamine transferase
MMHKFKVILSGGGTGGHIFPALSIAQALKVKYPESDFLFVGAKGKMEMEKVPNAGFKIVGLWISGIQRKQPFRNILFPLKLIVSLLKSIVIVLKFKPNVVVGTGGFASGPLLFIASIFGTPTLIQEQNSFPGITNKLLSKKAQKICVAYENLESFFPKEKLVFTGNPVRQDLLDLKEKQAKAYSTFNLNPNKKTLLVLGGSLGARRINQLVKAQLSYFQNNNIQVLWQCGKLYFKEYHNCSNKTDVQVMSFIKRMDLAYAAADVIISRAGASSVSELCIVGKPVIFIPSPNVAEDHQTKNAVAISSKKAALLIPEKNLKEDFESQFSGLINNENLQKTLAKNIKNLAKKSATNDIVNEIEKLINA